MEFQNTGASNFPAASWDTNVLVTAQNICFHFTICFLFSGSQLSHLSLRSSGKYLQHGSLPLQLSSANYAWQCSHSASCFKTHLALVSQLITNDDLSKNYWLMIISDAFSSLLIPWLSRIYWSISSLIYTRDTVYVPWTHTQSTILSTVLWISPPIRILSFRSYSFHTFWKLESDQRSLFCFSRVCNTY